MTDDKHDLASVLRRVQKLLAIAEDGRANPNEAAAAARMAEAVMRKYQIEHADVISAELTLGGAEAFASIDVGSTMNLDARDVKHASGWAGILAVPVAELNDCQARYASVPERGRTIRFSGYASDVQVCRYTFEFIVNSMAAASRRYLRDTGCSRAQAESFRRGYISACCASLKLAKRDKDAEMALASSSRDLVLVKESAVAKHFGAVSYGSKVSRTASANAFHHGHAEGSKLNVGSRGIGQAGSNAALLPE